jgi:hypothetical protein
MVGIRARVMVMFLVRVGLGFGLEFMLVLN